MRPYEQCIQQIVASSLSLSLCFASICSTIRSLLVYPLPYLTGRQPTNNEKKRTAEPRQTIQNTANKPYTENQTSREGTQQITHILNKFAPYAHNHNSTYILHTKNHTIVKTIQIDTA